MTMTMRPKRLTETEWAEVAARHAITIMRLMNLLRDKTYIRCKADYNRGHLSHGNYLNEKERGLNIGPSTDGVSSDAKDGGK